MDDPALLRKLPLLVHALIETFAAISFIFRPQSQLPGASEEARLVLRSYGGLLLAVNGTCLAVVIGPGFDSTARLVTAFVGSYHVWPIARAYTRIRSRASRQEAHPRVLGGPLVHVVIHALLLAALLGASFTHSGHDLDKVEL